MDWLARRRFFDRQNPIRRHTPIEQEYSFLSAFIGGS